MKCLRCGNEDPHTFFEGSKGWYCRKCIQFKRKLEEDQEGSNLPRIQEVESEYTLAYPLTPKQREIGLEVCKLVLQSDVLINAVCGAGKTEIVMEAIKQALKAKQRVAFAIARRQVVIEIRKRLADSFKECKVIAVCQGYTQITEGDIIVCTTHQLYRYHHQFDLLILDEPDAFPYAGNPILQQIARNSVRGKIIYMSATPDEYLLKQVKSGQLKMVHLNRRPHGFDLVVPTVKTGPKAMLLYHLFYWLKRKQKEGKQVLLFVPTIAIEKRLFLLMKHPFNCCTISSKSENIDQTIEAFKAKQYQCCITTTLLERGITIPGIDVCILYGDHFVFNEASLIQMIGRVGRSFDCPSGEGLFLCCTKSKAVKKCLGILNHANQAV